VGTVAEWRWGARRWLTGALAAGIGAQFWGLLVQPVGAGNSVLVVGLAASLLVLGLVDGPAPVRVAGVVGLLAGLVLLAGRDVHGGAAAIGALVAAPLARVPSSTRRTGS
jgi:hypothetical protein